MVPRDGWFRPSIGRAYLLGIDSALQRGKSLSRSNGTEEDRLELVHSSIAEKESWVIVWDDRRGGD